jgi:hypothetical protein
MTQLSLTDALHATTVAIERVEQGAGEQWNAEALAVIERVARRQPELTVNDIWKAGLSEPSCNRAIGAAMVRARKAKMIVATEKRQASLQTNMCPVRIWKSLMYGSVKHANDLGN